MPFNHQRHAGRSGNALDGRSRTIRLARFLVGIVFLLLLHDPAQAVIAPPLDQYDLTLEWDPSPSPEVVGNHLYFGTTSGDYTDDIAIGDVTSVDVSDLYYGVTYYFAVTAVGANGQESAFSNEFSYVRNLPAATVQTVPAATVQIQGGADGQFTLTVTGTTGHTYDIEATQDFNTWTVIGTETMGLGGSFNFTDTNAPSYSSRFYRMSETQP